MQTNIYYYQRPYASKIAGTPTESEFDLDKIQYTFSFIPFTKEQQQKLEQEKYDILDRIACTTEIFVPYFHYGGKPLKIQANIGECDYNEEKQTLYHTYDRSAVAGDTTITIQLSIMENEENASCSIM